MSRFIDAYDSVMFDLDGVVYLGPNAVPHAPEALAQLRELGVKVGFVTNNAGRSADVVVAQLKDLGIECRREDVVTSPQAIAQLMVRELPAGAKVQICGAQALTDEIAAVGFTIVTDFREEPVAVVQGYDPNLSWPSLDNAGWAIQRGARWFGTNTDISRPTHLGMVAGAGAQIEALHTAVPDAQITVAGKPYPPLLQETIARMKVTSPVFVGDRLDTDIEGAHNVDIDSFFVFTGAHGKKDLAGAIPQQRPTAIGWDISGLLAPRRQASTLEDGSVTCGNARAEISGRAVQITASLTSVDEQLDALWAIVQLTWADETLDAAHALDQLDKLH